MSCLEITFRDSERLMLGHPTRGSVGNANTPIRQYASDGELQLVAVRKHLPDVLKVRPISDHGNVNEIIGKFGGADQLRNAVNKLQSLLYAT